MENASAEELMIIYQQKSPDLALAAFHELYRRFSDKVYAFILKKCQNQADAEDIMQKVFIKIHESKHLYKKEYKFEQWLFVIARTAVIDFFRTSSRYAKKISHLGNSSEPSAFSNNALAFSDSLEQLNKDQKEMLEMKYIDELTYQEMAEHFKKSEVSLRKAISRLVLNLKKGEV